MEQDLKRDRLREAPTKVSVSKNVSTWWWLSPPAKLILEYIQTQKWRREHFKLLNPDDQSALINFTNKANGWLIVALGALLVSVNVSWQLGTELGWTWWLNVILIIFCIFISLLYTILRILRTSKLIEDN